MQTKHKKSKESNAWSEWDKERRSKFKDVDTIHKYMSTLEKLIQDYRDQKVV